MKQAVSEACGLNKCEIVTFNFFHVFVVKIMKLIYKITFFFGYVLSSAGSSCIGNHLPFGYTVIPCEKVAGVINCYIENLFAEVIHVLTFIP
jgi:hypothetical protein